VGLPHAYANSGKAYPVLYLLDANAIFGTVVETARSLAVLHEIPEIIVGMGYAMTAF
jgi:predicted alpha/beta superfamily hydrolase